MCVIIELIIFIPATHAEVFSMNKVSKITKWICWFFRILYRLKTADNDTIRFVNCINKYYFLISTYIDPC